MASQPNIEYEAAKFLQKLIQDSKDEPEKLATKLYVILQHMKASGKENSMPYQVISRAMETVVNQHGLDIESLKPPRNPTNTGPQMGDSINQHSAGCSQLAGAPQDSKSGLIENDSNRAEAFSSSRPPAGPGGAALDTFPGVAPHRTSISYEHESPSSIDTRSANSASYERRDSSSWEQQATQKDKRSSAKRKRPESSAADVQMDDPPQLDSHLHISDARKGTLTNKIDLPGNLPGAAGQFHAVSGAPSPYPATGGFSGGIQGPSLEPSTGKLAVGLDYRKQGPPKDAPTTFSQGHLLPTNQREMAMGGVVSGPDMSMQSGMHRDTRKSPLLSTPSPSMPFREHHLKQLRAQCLVFLAFRNGLTPKRLHLEIALGNTLPKEGSSAEAGQRELAENTGKEMTMDEPYIYPDIASLQGSAGTLKTERVPPVSSIAAGGLGNVISRKEAGSVPFADPARNDEERKQLLGTRRALENEMLNQESTALSPFLPTQSQPEISVKKPSDHDNNFDNGRLHPGAMNHDMPTLGMNKQIRPEMARWATVGGHSEASKAPLSASVAQHELLAGKDTPLSSSQGLGEIVGQGQQYADGNLSLPWKPVQGLNSEKQRMVPAHDVNMLMRHGSNASFPDAGHSIRDSAPFSQVEKACEPEETDNLSAGVPPPKYATSEKWITIQQKRRVVHEEDWIKKQQSVDQRIAARFKKLKETVSSSEDISAKTRSVIELKKLQLLELQRCLRSNMLNDFFKPITTEVDRLKAIKKHRVGRRLKHVEKYEQRMKEERQKRMRERQKEFFSEVEVHKERLDDVFKFKRERWKGFNRYIKEFHKKKERAHREKIDRIQREKINLLKINDVEGYLRMVQDAKSDRVNKLLKETEKYLQKLGARLQEAKTVTKHFETDADGNDLASVAESNDIPADTEDEGDQAKHYKESNEKYYLIAHSIKENITEQPAGLIGGKLREYQMNGLRWLVSLYNNHLNGILADEMGLGKTVQVISLICYLMEAKNDRGPFLVVVPSSVLPGWETELNFWAPGVNKIVYAGPPEERRRLFKECIIHQKFNVLLTTYEYLMNKHDRPKLSKIQWHYVIIDEGHRIKNASCKLNADLKHYQSSHRLLLTGTPLQNNLEELWALLNFLLPNIFNSSEDFSQWFNKPFEGNGDNPADEALLSEEENLLIINRLHQVLRPFVLRRLKHKVENELPEKIERLVRCEASAYQKLLMKRVEDNLGALGNSKARAVHNSVMELRNICNHPYISQLHVDEVDTMIPRHFLPPIVRLCGKLEMLDRLLPKLKATNHRVLFFSTMTRLLDVMEEYLAWKQYRYLRLDGHTSGQDRGALIDKFNRPDSPYFIFLLSIRAGGVGVNLQAADTVIIFDTDWNPQVDLQAQARAHRIGQKKDVLVLRLETVHTVEEQVRASAEHKLGVANQSITAGFFDNNTSAEDRREYLEALLRECKKEEAALVLGDDALNDLLARSELEIDVFESVDQKRREEELATWKTLTMEQGTDDSQAPLPSRLVTDADLKQFCEAMKAYEVSGADSPSDIGVKRKTGVAGGYDTHRYGRGKRAREVRSYEEQWSEEEFEKICQAESPDNPKLREELKDPQLRLGAGPFAGKTDPPSQIQQAPLPLSGELSGLIKTEVTPPVKRGRGRPRRMPLTPATVSCAAASVKPDTGLQKLSNPAPAILGSTHVPASTNDLNSVACQSDLGSTSGSGTTPTPPAYTGVPMTPALPVSGQSKGKNRKGQVGAEPVRRRGRKPGRLSSTVSASVATQVEFPEQSTKQVSTGGSSAVTGLPPLEESMPKSDLQDPFGYVGQCTPDMNVATGPGTSQSVTVVTDSESNPHVSGDLSGSRQTKNPQREGEAATVAEMPSCASADPIASKTTSDLAAVTVVDSGPLPSSAPIGSLSTSYTSMNPPPSKRQRKNSQSGSESSTPIANKSAGQLVTGSDSSANIIVPNKQVSVSPSSSDLPPGRRQRRKSQSGGEPVRRRGKRQTLAATIAAAPSAQHSIPNESTRNLLLSQPQAVAPVPPPPGGTSQSVGPQVVAVTVSSIDLVPGSVEGSAPLKDATLSLHDASVGSAPLGVQPHPSTALTCQPAVPHAPLKPGVQNQKGAAVETTPRRRGRIKALSSQASQDKPPSLPESTPRDSVEKVIMTGGQQNDAKELKKTTVEDSSVIQPPVLVSHHPNSAEHRSIAKSKDSNAPSSFVDKADLETNELDKRLEGSNSSLTKEVGTSIRLKNPPPKSSTIEESSLHPGRRTTVVVLALKTSAPISECKISQDEVNLDDKVSQPQVHVKSNAETTSHPDEDMAAPPGFDTPHAYATDAIETNVSSGKEDVTDKEVVAACKGVMHTKSTHTDGADQSLVDPVHVSGEESAPPGFGVSDRCGLKTIAVTSPCSELKDAPAASSAQTQASELPTVPAAACHENMEDSKDSVEMDTKPPGSSVVQSPLAEDDSGKVVFTGTGEVLGEATPIEVPSQAPPAGEDPKNLSSSEGKSKNLPLSPGRTPDVDVCVENSIKESLKPGTEVAQEECHVRQETVFDPSGGGDKSDPRIVSATKDECMTVISDENSVRGDILPANDDYCVPQADARLDVIDEVGSEPAMREQGSIQKSGIDPSSGDGIITEVTNEINVHVSMEEDHQKNLRGAAEARPYPGSTLVNSESEVYEQESSNEANSIPDSSEPRDLANEILADMPKGKDEDDQSAQLDLPLASNQEIDICKSKADSILSVDSSLDSRELADKTLGAAEAQNCSPAIAEHVGNTQNVDSSSVSVPVITDDQNKSVEWHDIVSPDGILSDPSASKAVNGGVLRDCPAVSPRNEEESGQMVERESVDVDTSQNNVEGDGAKLERRSDALFGESKPESCGGLKEPDESAEPGKNCSGRNSSLELETDASWDANAASYGTEVSAAKEDVAAIKGVLQTESSPTVGSDQNQMDPVQVSVRESASSGLDFGDVFGLQTVAVGSSCSELKDVAATPSAQTPVSESPAWPAAACHDNVDDSEDFVVEDSAAPAFSGVQSQLAEDECREAVLTETGKVLGETSVEATIKAPTAGEGPGNQSSIEGAHENLPLLPASTLDADGCLDNNVKESLQDTTKIAQEESQVHKEAVSYSPNDRDKSGETSVEATIKAPTAGEGPGNQSSIEGAHENLPLLPASTLDAHGCLDNNVKESPQDTTKIAQEESQVHKEAVSYSPNDRDKSGETSVEATIKAPTAGEGLGNQSSIEGANENLPLLPASTLDADGCLDNNVKESLQDTTKIAKEESQVHKEAVSYSPSDRDKSDPSIVSGTKYASMAVISDEDVGKGDILPEIDNCCEPQADADTNADVDVGHEPAMHEQESIHESGTGSSSRGGINAEVTDEINIHVSVEEDHQKNLQGAAEAQPNSGGTSANSESEVYEQENDNKANLIPDSSESGQPAGEISTEMHGVPPELKNEDDQSAQSDISLALNHEIDICKSEEHIIPSTNSSLESRELAEEAVGVAEAQNSSPAMREHVDNTDNVDSSLVGISVSDDRNHSAELHGNVSPSGTLSDPSASKDVNVGVQSDHPAVSPRSEEESGQMVENKTDNLGASQNDVEGGEAKVEKHSDAFSTESKSESFGGLQQHDERAELAETSLEGNVSCEMETNASCDANDTSKAESTSTGNRVENIVQIRDDATVSTPGLAENSEKYTHPDGENVGECDTSNISLTREKDEVHSLEELDANDPSAVRVEEDGAGHSLDSKSNTLEPHGHVRSSDAGNDLASASKDDNSQGLDAPTIEAHSEACVVQDERPTADKSTFGSGLAGISEAYSSSSDEENLALAEDAPNNSLTTGVDASLASQDQDGSEGPAFGPQLESAYQNRPREPLIGPQLESADEDISNQPATSLEPVTASPEPEVAEPGGSGEPE